MATRFKYRWRQPWLASLMVLVLCIDPARGIVEGFSAPPIYQSSALSIPTFSQQAVTGALFISMPYHAFQKFRRIGFIQQTESFLKANAGWLSGVAFAGMQIASLALLLHGHGTAAFLISGGGFAPLHVWVRNYDPGTKLLDGKERHKLFEEIKMRRDILLKLKEWPEKGIQLNFKKLNGNLKKFVVEITKGDWQTVVRGQELSVLGSDLKFRVAAVDGANVTLEIVSAMQITAQPPEAGTLINRTPDASLDVQVDALESLMSQMVEEEGGVHRGRPTTDPHRLFGMAGQTTPKGDQEPISFIDPRIRYYTDADGTPHGDESRDMTTRLGLNPTQVVFIEGFAGTSKSTVLNEVVQQVTRRGEDILVMSQMHQPINGIIEDKMMKTAKETGIEVPTLRLGNDPANFRNRTQQFWWGFKGRPKTETQEALPAALERFAAAKRTYKERFGKTIGGAYFATVIGATTDRYLNKELEGKKLFKVIIIDEATRATLSEVLAALRLLAPDGKVIFVGDQKQLPPFGLTEEEKKYLRGVGFSEKALESFGMSAFEFLLDGPFGRVFGDRSKLLVNYRSVGTIVAFLSELIYDGLMKAFDQTTGDPEALRLVDIAKPNLSADLEEQTPEGSYFNRTSAAEDMKQVRYLHYKKGIALDKITLITPYTAQVTVLSEMLMREFPQAQTYPVVTTVDTYQGSENEAVIYDPVRSNSKRRIGFVNDLRRLNVALSRASKILVIVWDGRVFNETVSKGDNDRDKEARKKFGKITNLIRDLHSAGKSSVSPLPPAAPAAAALALAVPTSLHHLSAVSVALHAFNDGQRLQAQFEKEMFAPLRHAPNIATVAAQLQELHQESPTTLLPLCNDLAQYWENAGRKPQEVVSLIEQRLPAGQPLAPQDHAALVVFITHWSQQWEALRQHYTQQLRIWGTDAELDISDENLKTLYNAIPSESWRDEFMGYFQSHAILYLEHHAEDWDMLHLAVEEVEVAALKISGSSTPANLRGLTAKGGTSNLAIDVPALTTFTGDAMRPIWATRDLLLQGLIDNLFMASTGPLVANIAKAYQELSTDQRSMVVQSFEKWVDHLISRHKNNSKGLIEDQILINKVYGGLSKLADVASAPHLLGEPFIKLIRSKVSNAIHEALKREAERQQVLREIDLSPTAFRELSLAEGVLALADDQLLKPSESMYVTLGQVAQDIRGSGQPIIKRDVNRIYTVLKGRDSNSRQNKALLDLGYITKGEQAQAFRVHMKAQEENDLAKESWGRTWSEVANDVREHRRTQLKAAGVSEQEYYDYLRLPIEQAMLGALEMRSSMPLDLVVYVDDPDNLRCLPDSLFIESNVRKMVIMTTQAAAVEEALRKRLSNPQDFENGRIVVIDQGWPWLKRGRMGQLQLALDARSRQSVKEKLATYFRRVAAGGPKDFENPHPDLLEKNTSRLVISLDTLLDQAVWTQLTIDRLVNEKFPVGTHEHRHPADLMESPLAGPADFKNASYVEQLMRFVEPMQQGQLRDMVSLAGPNGVFLCANRFPVLDEGDKRMTWHHWLESLSESLALVDKSMNLWDSQSKKIAAPTARPWETREYQLCYRGDPPEIFKAQKLNPNAWNQVVSIIEQLRKTRSQSLSPGDAAARSYHLFRKAIRHQLLIDEDYELSNPAEAHRQSLYHAQVMSFLSNEKAKPLLAHGPILMEVARPNDLMSVPDSFWVSKDISKIFILTMDPAQVQMTFHGLVKQWTDDGLYENADALEEKLRNGNIQIVDYDLFGASPAFLASIDSVIRSAKNMEEAESMLTLLMTSLLKQENDLFQTQETTVLRRGQASLYISLSVYPAIFGAAQLAIENALRKRFAAEDEPAANFTQSQYCRYIKDGHEYKRSEYASVYAKVAQKLMANHVAESAQWMIPQGKFFMFHPKARVVWNPSSTEKSWSQGEPDYSDHMTYWGSLMDTWDLDVSIAGIKSPKSVASILLSLPSSEDPLGGRAMHWSILSVASLREITKPYVQGNRKGQPASQLGQRLYSYATLHLAWIVPLFLNIDWGFSLLSSALIGAGILAFSVASQVISSHLPIEAARTFNGHTTWMPGVREKLRAESPFSYNAARIEERFHAITTRFVGSLNRELNFSNPIVTLRSLLVLPVKLADEMMAKTLAIAAASSAALGLHLKEKIQRSFVILKAAA